MAISGDNLGLSWKRIFQITFFVGMFGGFTLFSIASYFFPPRDARIHVEYDWSAEGINVIDGEDVPEATRTPSTTTEKIDV